MSSPPLYWTWDGEAMWPAGRFARIAREHFTRGQVYRLVEEQERSRVTHDHFFAAVHQAWHNLPEDEADRFPSPEHLRKWALIKTGYRVESTWVLPTVSEAMRTAEILRKLDDFAIVLVNGQTVSHFRAKSQSRREMSGKEFQASKTAVLDLLAQIIDVTPTELAKAGPMV